MYCQCVIEVLNVLHLIPFKTIPLIETPTTVTGIPPAIEIIPLPLDERTCRAWSSVLILIEPAVLHKCLQLLESGTMSTFLSSVHQDTSPESE